MLPDIYQTTFTPRLVLGIWKEKRRDFKKKFGWVSNYQQDLEITQYLSLSVFLHKILSIGHFPSLLWRVTIIASFSSPSHAAKLWADPKCRRATTQREGGNNAEKGCMAAPG
ncbi:unnamed protein product [Cuscuta campestris]|uniref:Uncharacterized protein n=1 Tax=Cuscuta campestris TaxID=132261 RepID=A0A484NM36_9ASTE|nr:unnamed protein product [Cuscuta campestris]